VVVWERTFRDVCCDEQADLVGEGEACRSNTSSQSHFVSCRLEHLPQKTANGNRCFVLMKSEPESQNSNVEAWMINGSRPIKGCRTFCPFFFVAL
jgi:hypothetical protein